MIKIGAIIQARTGSTRLPGKVLKHLPYDSEITVLQQVIRRTKKSNIIDEVIIATTIDKEDEEIVKIAKKESVKWFRGSKENVLERYYKCAKKYKIDIIVRITSDCPALDYNIVDKLISKHLKERNDYTGCKSLPIGVCAEVINFSALEIAYNNATKDFEKEHVCPYFYITKKEEFKISMFEPPKELRYPDIRVTLDTEEDYAFLCCIFDYLYKKNPYFDTYEIIKLINEKPWLKLINKKILQKKIFSSLDEELEEAIKLLDLQNLKNAKKYIEKFLKRGNNSDI